MGLLVRPAGQTSWTDQLDGPAGQISWTDQFFLFEALASSHIRRFSFQFVHCWSFWVRRRPCFSRSTFLFKEVLDSSSLNKRTYLDKVGGSSKNFRVDPFPAGFKLAFFWGGLHSNLYHYDSKSIYMPLKIVQIGGRFLKIDGQNIWVEPWIFGTLKKHPNLPQYQFFRSFGQKE